MGNWITTGSPVRFYCMEQWLWTGSLLVADWGLWGREQNVLGDSSDRSVCPSLGWLDDIGLPQYKTQFDEGKVDGRMLHYMSVVSKWLLLFLTSFPCSWLLSVQRTPWNSSECPVLMPIAGTCKNQILLLTCKHFLSSFPLQSYWIQVEEHSEQEFGVMHEKWAILSWAVVCDTSVLRQGSDTICSRCANAVGAIHAFAVRVVIN